MVKTKVSVAVITARSAEDLNHKISTRLQEGWEPIGSHHVVVKNVRLRYSGTMHKDSVNELEYSITMRREEE